MAIVTQKAVFPDGKVIEGANAQVLMNILENPVKKRNVYGVEFQDVPEVKEARKKFEEHFESMKEIDRSYCWEITYVDPFNRIDDENDDMKRYFKLHQEYEMAIEKVRKENSSNPFVELFSDTSDMRRKFTPSPVLIMEVFEAIMAGELTEDSELWKEGEQKLKIVG